MQSVNHLERTIHWQLRVGPRGPHILIVSLDRRMILGDNVPESHVCIRVRVRYMMDHLSRCPAAVAIWRVELLIGETFHRTAKGWRVSGQLRDLGGTLFSCEHSFALI
jgi:hypothetical protein